jgi:hypothetical protein
MPSGKGAVRRDDLPQRLALAKLDQHRLLQRQQVEMAEHALVLRRVRGHEP